ncbi:ferredoxin [Aciditerrimonas ferrireducens]|jgi:ferredoxin|uniref:Ferredoxin n=1 Tax=Aciditerrimonas ferrireducens TaxID=667306 RepID=A0ABV6C5J7_9ACTN
MEIKVSVDKDLCIGTGNCAFFAPEVFEIGDDAQARVLDPEARPIEEVIWAAEQCPIRAIRVWRDGTQIV